MKYYLTTPIYYVNAAPHLGTAYSTFVADLIKRFKKMEGFDPVVFTTGSDEHSRNVERAADAANLTPREYTDKMSAEFVSQWKRLGIDYDHFIRTSDPEASRNRALAVPALPEKRLHLQRLVHRPVLRER